MDNDGVIVKQSFTMGSSKLCDELVQDTRTHYFCNKNIIWNTKEGFINNKF